MKSRALEKQDEETNGPFLAELDRPPTMQSCQVAKALGWQDRQRGCFHVQKPVH